jgi:hypothetical protein
MPVVVAPAADTIPVADPDAGGFWAVTVKVGIR